MYAGAEPAEMFGVDGAGAFAEAKAVTEDLRPTNASGVDERAQCVETEEAFFLRGVRLVRRDGAGAAVDERAERPRRWAAGRFIVLCCGSGGRATGRAGVAAGGGA